MESGTAAETLEYRYKFVFPDGGEREFPVRLDVRSLRLRLPERDACPEWTRLAHSRCPVCTLGEDEHPRCPAAESLTDVVEFFKDHVSFDRVRLEVSSETRTVVRETPLWMGVSALIGLHMVTSGCPVLDKFKPMARTHLPFATPRETFYRILSTYLLAQYFRLRKGGDPDWELKGLLALVEEIRSVNQAFCERLRDVCPEDANFNAIIRLDTVADSLAMQIEEDGLREIAESFEAYL